MLRDTLYEIRIVLIHRVGVESCCHPSTAHEPDVSVPCMVAAVANNRARVGGNGGLEVGRVVLV